jgi:hypothetical protein
MKSRWLPLVLLLGLLFIVFNKYREGYTQCSYYRNCKDCLANNNLEDEDMPSCWWSDTKGCSAFDGDGFSRTCGSTPDPKPDTRRGQRRGQRPDPSPSIDRPDITLTPSALASPSSCPMNKSCNDCVTSDCFWGSKDQKCSFFKLNGYSSVCPSDCPTYSLITVPTYVRT